MSNDLTQYCIVRDLLNRDVEDVLREIVPKLGICQEGNTVHRVWQQTRDVATAALAKELAGVLLAMSLSEVSLVAVGSALRAILAFRGLEKVCEQYGASQS